MLTDEPYVSNMLFVVWWSLSSTVMVIFAGYSCYRRLNVDLFQKLKSEIHYTRLIQSFLEIWWWLAINGTPKFSASEHPNIKGKWQTWLYRTTVKYKHVLHSLLGQGWFLAPAEGFWMPRVPWKKPSALLGFSESKKVSDFVHDHLEKGRPPHYVRCGKIMEHNLYCVSVLFVQGIIQREQRKSLIGS